MFPKILSNINVLDFSRLLPGPFASDLLIKMGAKVHCVLPPVGDPMLGDYSPFASLKRGKQFETIDLKSKSGLARVRALVADSEILLEGFRPGTLARLGLGFEGLQKIKPDLLYVSLNGYDEKHPKYLHGAHDLNFLADSGLYSLIFADESSEIPLLQLGDLLGGFYAVLQILMEWVSRANTTPEKITGKHLKISITQACEVLGEYLKDPATASLAPMLTGGVARYNIYQTKDKKRLVVAAIEPKFFGRLMEALQLPYGAQDDGEEVIQALEAKFREKTLSQWQVELKNIDACISFVPTRQAVLEKRLNRR